jgi:hypothetical protein
MSSTLTTLLLVIVGVVTLALGLVHLVIPRWFDFPMAIGRDGAGLPPLKERPLGPWIYQLRRQDALGLSWVMSNAASYVLLSIGVVDLAWASGWRGLPVVGCTLWIAGWWVLRTAGQFAVGRRAIDIAFAAGFATLAVVHLGLAASWPAS